MRIIAGRNRGTQLTSPPHAKTRPTSDRARENLFNIVANGKWSPYLRGGKIADFFAGTGAVGLEALSRGADYCWFFETDRQAIMALKNNIAKCRYEAITHIQNRSALTPGHAPDGVKENGLDILFLDPPYYDNLANLSVAAALQTGWIGSNTLVIVQYHPDDPVDLPDALQIMDNRQYGATHFVFALLQEAT